MEPSEWSTRDLEQSTEEAGTAATRGTVATGPVPTQRARSGAPRGGGAAAGGSGSAANEGVSGAAPASEQVAPPTNSTKG